MSTIHLNYYMLKNKQEANNNKNNNDSLLSHKPFLIAISAPSGCGKTTVCKALRNMCNKICASISYTTRHIRINTETDGIDYHFISKAEFEKKIEDGFFLENAKILDNYYGSSLEAAKTILEANSDILFDIDWQGVEQIKKSKLPFISIFLLPPSMEQLRKRLINRKTHSKQELETRLSSAINDIKQITKYDYIVINDNLETCINDTLGIIRSERLKRSRQTNILKIIDKFTNEIRQYPAS